MTEWVPPECPFCGCVMGHTLDCHSTAMRRALIAERKLAELQERKPCIICLRPDCEGGCI